MHRQIEEQSPEVAELTRQRDELRRQLEEAQRAQRTPSWQERWIEAAVGWLKYPVIGVTVLLFLWAVDRHLGIKIQELTIFGVSFRAAERADSTFQEIQNRVLVLQDEFTRELESLRARTASLTPAEARSLERQSFEEAQVVSPQLASLSQPIASRTGVSLLAGKKGHIWIGNFDGETGRWSPVKLKSLDGRSLSGPPASIAAGQEYEIDANIVLRDGEPSTGRDYYRAVAPVGVVPRHSIVVAAGAARAYDRGYAVQYWLPVEVKTVR